MKCHALIRKISISDEKAMGLDTSNVVVETVPLIINTSDARRIARSENGWTDNGQDLAGK